jgi:8-oxo-dGTP diphosphatase
MRRPDDLPILVAAAVIERGDCFLLTTRPAGTHLAGCWEFPGGKCEDGETPEQCLARELREELAVEATVREETFRTRHRYTDRLLELRFFRCDIAGVPRAVQGQEVRWVARAELSSLRFPPADAEFIGEPQAPRIVDRHAADMRRPAVPGPRGARRRLANARCRPGVFPVNLCR